MNFRFVEHELVQLPAVSASYQPPLLLGSSLLLQ